MKTPAPPDPVKTAQAQAGMNRDTAITQQQLNMVDQFNPWGSTTYNKTGDDGFYDSQGKWISTPRYSQTVTLSPEQQAIFDQTQAAQGNLAGLANEQSEFLRDYLNKPFSFDNQDAADWAYDLGATRLDPRFAREEEGLRTRLANQGIQEGSAAWNNAMSQLGQSKNDAYNQLMLQGRSQAFNEALQGRSQPINELTALLSGTQITNPGTQSPGTPQTGVANVDYTGLVADKYKADSAAAQAKMGGLFGLLSAPFQMFQFSDIRLKDDIRRVGTTEGGTPIYTYRYKGDPVTHMGVMAQDVPEAASAHESGYLMVDYRKVH